MNADYLYLQTLLKNDLSALSFDLIITNGRVIDPERYLDDVRNVGIRAYIW